MSDQLPLLVFPQKRNVQPEKGKPAFSKPPHLPNKARQIERFGLELNALQESWAQYKASLSDAIAGFEPETVLVIEIIGRVDRFRAAVEESGLNWLGEWDQTDIEPDEDFYELDKFGNRTTKPLSGRLFLSMVNERGMGELLSLWKLWVTGKPLPRGKTPWKAVFSQLRSIRRWGVRESLEETGMLEQWRAALADSIDTDAVERFQVEFFYHQNLERRKRNEQQLRETLVSLGGSVIGSPIDIKPIAFHAVKGELPRTAIEQLLRELSGAQSDIRIDLLKLSSIMFFRPTGQSLAVSSGEEGQPGVVGGPLPDLDPVAALLDGVPLQQHEALRDRLDVDDVFDLERLYQPGERKHGTAMASLIVHGDTGSGVNAPLRRRLLCVPIMQPDLVLREGGKFHEHMPDDVFFEYRIHIAVRRILVGNDNLPAQAPQIKVINLSIGDPSRQLAHTMSPLARLLDWLSYEYRVLFCVSAGNYAVDIQMGLPHSEFAKLTDEKKVETTLKAMHQSLADRRLLSPAESMNALTVGALHADEFGDGYYAGTRVDLMPNQKMPSPAMRLGSGFRRSVKPEVLFPSGRQLYKEPIPSSNTFYEVDGTVARGPGQHVATDSKESGKLSEFAYWKGTSNATALATRGAIHIHDMLQNLREQQGQDIPDGLMAVLMKTLLVHGARQPEEAKTHFISALKTSSNSRQFRTVLARYMGYGAADIERVLACTEQRATVLGCNEIRESEVHEYEFPLPACLSKQRLWRRLVVTLAWFTPINPAHRNLREAKLALSPAGSGSNWKTMPLRLDRVDADNNQMLRGTVQHEVLESKNEVSAFQDGDVLKLRVHCKPDGVERLDQVIPYGLAVTLEVKEDLPIYQEIKSKISGPVEITVR